MSIWRRRPDRIRGIAGSLENKNVLVLDGASGAGPGVVRVAAAAGAQATLASPDHVAVDLQLRKLADTPKQVAGLVVNSRGDLAQVGELAGSLPDGLVVNPSHLDLDTPETLSPQQGVALANTVAEGLRDAGRLGSIVLVTAIPQEGPAASAAAYLRSEMEQLASRVATNGIRVNAVAAGRVAVNRRGKPISNRSSLLGHVSLHPVEVGKSVWFLLNDDLSGGITGTTLTIDRGASLLRPGW